MEGIQEITANITIYSRQFDIREPLKPKKMKIDGGSKRKGRKMTQKRNLLRRG